MDRVTAAKLMAICQEIAEQLNRANDLVGTISDQREQQRLRRVVGELMQTVSTELVAPVTREYPDFDPNRKSAQ